MPSDTATGSTLFRPAHARPISRAQQCSLALALRRIRLDTPSAPRRARTFAGRVSRASDRAVCRLLAALHRYNDEHQYLGVLSIIGRLRAERDRGIHWSAVHDAIATFPLPLARGHGWSLYAELFADEEFLRSEGHRGNLKTVLALLAYRGGQLKIGVMLAYLQSPHWSALGWRRACRVWPRGVPFAIAHAQSTADPLLLERIATM